MTWMLLLAVAVAGVWLASVYNGLIGLRNAVKNAWAQIDVQLKRRHDLIPNLVETVKGYMTHERQTLEAVTMARQQAVQASGGVAEQARLENALSQTLRSLFAVTESYPELKSNQNFLALQEEINSTENRISFARQAYNDSVLGYNNAAQRFPSNVAAALFAFAAAEPFAVAETERAVPGVKF